MTYSLSIRNGKRLRIEADCFINALNKALLRYPGKFIVVKYSKAMRQYLAKINPKDHVLVTQHGGITACSLRDIEDDDILVPIINNNVDLVTAKKEAETRSKADVKKKVYINVKPDGECMLEDKEDETTHAVYAGGKAQPATHPLAKAVKAATPAKATTNVAAKTSKTKKMAKTATKKAAPAKKTAAPVKKTESKKLTAPAVASPGKLKVMTVKLVLKEIEKGARAYNEAGKVLTPGYLAKMVDKDREIKVSIA